MVSGRKHVVLVSCACASLHLYACGPTCMHVTCTCYACLHASHALCPEDAVALGNLRREMELRRFDHVQLLNDICTQKRLELIEIVCASFLAFVTFFHEGDFCAQYLKEEVDLVSALIPIKKQQYEAFKQAAQKQVRDAQVCAML